MVKERDFGIDVLKMLAVITIVWSHLDNVLPGSLSKLATGGSFGDGFFFFCSGFTILMGGAKNFPNYYKKRIYRIFPSVIVWSMFSMLLFGTENRVQNLINGGWFLECIMIYYFPLWFIKRYGMNYIPQIFLVYSLLFVAFFVYYNHGIQVKMINDLYQKSAFFFFVMLLGAYTGIRRKLLSDNSKIDLVGLILSIIIFFGGTYALKFNTYLQMLSVVGLIGTCYFTYKLCNSKIVKKIFSEKHLYKIMRFIGSLCLEIYFVNIPLINATASLNWVLRLILIAVLCVLSAYVIRTVSKFLLQTFNEKDYNWKEIIKLY